MLPLKVAYNLLWNMATTNLIISNKHNLTCFPLRERAETKLNWAGWPFGSVSLEHIAAEGRSYFFVDIIAED